MSYTTGFVSDVTPVDEYASPQRSFRPVAVGATVIGFGAMAAALVIASMAATSAMLDALSSSPETHAEAPRAPAQAKSERGPGIAASAHAAATAPAGSRPDMIADAKSPPVSAPSAASAPVAAAPSAARAVDITPDLALSSVPLPPARSAALASPAEAPSSVPLPPSRSAALPSTTAAAPSVTATPRSAPPPVVAATSLTQPAPSAEAQNVASSASPATDSSVVPLPPRRPGSFEVASLPPQTDTSLPSPARPSPVIARTTPSEAKPPVGETKLQKSVATAPNAAGAPQDNRNFFQRLFGVSSQPSTPSVPGAGNRTAIYDISAHTVYMPNGERLEAHSGLGGSLDDPRTIRDKNRGVTPPNVYQLALREQLFHGVPALRLNPVNENSMYGRAGMLAHTYMLGARGDSNGCVSFRDYNKFLQAYKNGQVTHLVVVAHSGDAPMSFASARPDRDVR
jgi:hypothetical protein